MDDDTFASFYRETAPALRSYVRRATGDPWDAEDIVQEAFCRLLRTPVAAAAAREARAYVYRIAANLVVERWRRARRERVAAPLSREAVRDAPDHALRDTLRRTLRCLSVQERRLLWLACVVGADHGAIADSLGLARGSVKVLLCRTRRRLRALLRPTVEQPRRAAG